MCWASIRARATMRSIVLDAVLGWPRTVPGEHGQIVLTDIPGVERVQAI